MISPEKIAEMLAADRLAAIDVWAAGEEIECAEDDMPISAQYFADVQSLVAEVASSRSELLTLRAERDEARDSDDEMLKISALIARLQSTLDQFGDTCVYIRRGGLSWGAVALNRRSDDEKNGVLDLQATHDRAMEERLGQVQRLIEDKNGWRDKALAAEAQLARQGEALRRILDANDDYLAHNPTGEPDALTTACDAARATLGQELGPIAWHWWTVAGSTRWPVWSLGVGRPNEAPSDAIPVYAARSTLSPEDSNG